MSFRCEDEIVDVDQQVRFVGEEQVQVLDGFRQQVRVHAIFVFASSDVVDRSISASDFRVFLERFKNFLSYLKVVMVAGGLVKEVSRFYELWTKVVLTPMNLKEAELDDLS